MRPFSRGNRGIYHLLLAAVIVCLFVTLAAPLPALATKYPTNTGTVTGTAAGSAQIDVSASYTINTGANCGGGTDNQPTFEVQWDLAPADWVGYGTSGALSDTGGTPFTYSITTGITSGQTYAIRVIYNDTNGVNACGGASQTVDGNNVTLPNNLLTVSTASANIDSSAQITVTAAFTGDENGNSTTKVEYNTSDTWPGTSKCASISGSSPRICIVNGLQPNTQYWFRITHTDSDGVSGTNPRVIGPYTTLNGQKISCGSCHGAVTKTPAYEAPGLPLDADNCDNNGRGLHGIHNNYSSATYKKNANGERGNCAYCHTATTDKAPTATHNNMYINITGYNSSGINSTGLRVSAGTCTNACHRNRAEAAPWGSYTSAAIVLSCRSCHDDSQDRVGLSGKHDIHLLSNCTTPSGTRMSEPANAGCLNCHPDNRSDLWSQGRADDGTKKAYPHALDGTNVVADNAALQGQISAASKSGTNTTCTNACHGRLAVTWGQAMDCNMCHYWAATPIDTANTGTGAVSAGHNPHFRAGKTCANCHPDNTDASHASRVPAQTYNAKVIKTGMTYNLPEKTCTNTGAGCHNNPATPTPAWGTTGNGCTTCHNYPDGANWPAGNGHEIQYSASVTANTHLKDAASYSRTLDTYSSVVNDPGKCGKCHKGLKSNHNNSSTNLNSAGAGYGYCGADFTITVTSPGTDVTCDNVKCHSGRTTPNWW